MKKYEIKDSKLIILDCCNEPVPVALFNLVKKVTFGANYNFPLPDIQNKNIEKIIFRGAFNQSINNLPLELKHLHLGESYNLPIVELPEKIETLVLSHCFNHPIRLPNTLKIFKMGMFFNQPINKLPEKLEYLFVGENFSFPLPELPVSLKEIKVSPFNKNAEKLNFK